MLKRVGAGILVGLASVFGYSLGFIATTYFIPSLKVYYLLFALPAFGWGFAHGFKDS